MVTGESKFSERDIRKREIKNLTRQEIVIRSNKASIKARRNKSSLQEL